MKAKLALLVLLTVLSTAVFATEGEKKATRSSNIEVVKKDETVFNLIYKGSPSLVSVTIVNEVGNKVFAEKINKLEGFSRPYNFEELPYGTYTFIVEDEFGSMNDQVSYTKSRPSSKPVLIKCAATSLKEDGYILTIVNDRPKRATVRIFDANRKLLYEKQEVIKGNFSKLYTFSRIDKAFNIEVEIENQTEVFSF